MLLSPIGCEEYQFSNTQKNTIRSDYLSSRRSYLRTGVVPATDTVTGPVDYIFPIDNEETPAYNLVELDWEDTPGANQYLVVIDRIGSFTLQPQRYIVTESELELDNLNPNLRYFWRVWPFNESFTGAGWSATQSFTTGTSTSVQEIASVNDFSIFPNPSTNGQVTLSINSTETFDADIEVYSMSGQVVVRSANQQVNQGGWNMELQTDSFAPGLYIVQVKSHKGILATKLSVQ